MAGMMGIDRRRLMGAAAAGGALWMAGGAARAAAGPDLKPFRAAIEAGHEASVRRLQTWIRQPSIAAENRGMEEGCALTMEMLKEAGFQSVTRMPTDGQPGVFATLDAGARRTVGLYFPSSAKVAIRSRHSAWK